MAQTGMFRKSFSLFTLNNSFRKLQINLNSLIMNMRTSTREKLKGLNIPEKPKKPLTPYTRFVKDNQSGILRENPSWKQSQIFKKVAENWKHVSEVDKQKLQESYKAEKNIYDQKILEYYASLTPDQREVLEDAKDEKEKDKATRKKKKLFRETNRPKKPLSPYMTYVLEQSKMRNVVLKDLMVSCKDEWHNLPNNEREKYTSLFAKEKELYEVALKKWEEKMITEGHEDVVRVKSLEAIKSSRERHAEHKKPEKSQSKKS